MTLAELQDWRRRCADNQQVAAMLEVSLTIEGPIAL